MVDNVCLVLIIEIILDLSQILPLVSKSIAIKSISLISLPLKFRRMVGRRFSSGQPLETTLVLLTIGALSTSFPFISMNQQTQQA